MRKFLPLFFTALPLFAQNLDYIQKGHYQVQWVPLDYDSLEKPASLFDSDESISIHTAFIDEDHVYLVGNKNTANSDGFLWVDGAINPLGVTNFTFHDFLVVQGNRYILGAHGVNDMGWPNKASYWINEERFPLEGKDCQVTDLFIHERDVYVAGSFVGDEGIGIACYWENGRRSDLIDLDSNPYVSHSEASAIHYENGNVYIMGEVIYDDGRNRWNEFSYWKNENRSIIEPIDSISRPFYYIDDVNLFVEQEHSIYIVQAYGDVMQNSKSIISINGEMEYYDHGDLFLDALMDLVVLDNIIYTCGTDWQQNDGRQACFWFQSISEESSRRHNRRKQIPLSEEYGNAEKIYISGNQVLIYGSNIYTDGSLEGGYWIISEDESRGFRLLERLFSGL